MNSTLLARKKLSQVFGSTPMDRFEMAFRNQILYRDLKKDKGGIICNQESIDNICKTAMDWEVDIIGVETSTESPNGLEVFTWENYFDNELSTFWCLKALKPLLERIPNPILRFYINIPYESISKISESTGIPY